MPPEVVSEFALSLAFAVVGASTAPLLLLDEHCDILAASASFCAAFGLAPDAVAGTSLYRLGAGEWDLPRLRVLLDATRAGAEPLPAYELDLLLPDSGVRRLDLNARMLGAAGDDERFLLLSVTDLTDARLAAQQHSALVAEKVVLLQELQHRIANSLQIIASVLMQGARRAQASPEARAHLREAHNRVMSVAALQRQLADSESGDVDLRAYLRQLCQSLAASMIDDRSRVTLVAECDASHLASSASVSLGLVVTELVINALKHAFPRHRPGTIRVSYAADDGGWTLTVADDGVGMPAAHDAIAGLGTSIVNALAQHLGADVVVSDAGPGTRVALIHHDPVGSRFPVAAAV